MQVSSGTLLAVAAMCVAVAACCDNVTLVSGDYRGVLLVSLLGAVAANLCCAILAARGGLVRWVAIALAIPSLFVLADAASRVPFV
jgi:hypothetical protein